VSCKLIMSPQSKIWRKLKRELLNRKEGQTGGGDGQSEHLQIKSVIKYIRT